MVVRVESEGSYEVSLNWISTQGWSVPETISFAAVADADNPPTNLAISRTLLTQVDPSQPPRNAEYELVVTNVGTVAMNSVTIIDRHSAAQLVQIVATDPAATSVDQSVSLVTWELGPLAPGEEVRVRETITAIICVSAESVMVVTVETEAGVEENYALVEREPVRFGSCPVEAPPDSTTIDGSPGGDSSSGDGTGGDSSEVAGLAVGAIGAPTTGTGPTASTGGPSLRAAAALAMAGVVAFAVGMRQTRRRER